MSNEKFILVKGRGGMGNRILSLLGAILYGQITQRKLIVDWSDGAYSSDRSNIFTQLFHLQNVNQAADLPNTNSILPQIWRNNIHKSFEDILAMHNIPDKDIITSNFLTESKYRINIGQTNYQEDLLVRWSYFAEIHRLRRAFKGDFKHLKTLDDKTILQKLIRNHLSLQPNIQEKINTFKNKYYTTETVIGVHVRYTDRKNPFQQYKMIINKILQKCPESIIFLATDSKLVKSYFQELYGEQIISFQKWFPDETSTLARLHFNPNCPDKLENAIQALIDMYLLGKCQYLLCDQTSTFAVVAELISDMPQNNIFDTSRYSLKRNLQKFNFLLERWF